MQKLLILTWLLLAGSLTVQAGDSVWDAKTTPAKGATQDIKVYHSPTCSCCTGWIEHLQKHGFKVDSIKIDDVYPIKEKAGLPENMASCHTAFIGDYVIEGHVPAGDIEALLASGDKTISGLAVPEMVTGTPGMEMSDRKDKFDVMAFDRDGNTKVFHHYENY